MRARHRTRFSTWRYATAAALVVAGCAGSPLMPFSTDAPPLVLAPAAQAGITDQRARFREIYCAVLDARAGEVPDHEPASESG